MVKVTYTLDAETVARIRRAAERLHKPQSQIVREAVRDYSERTDRLTDEEQTRMVAAIKTMIARAPTRTAEEVDAELREIRAVRRPGRLHDPERRRP